MDIFPIPGFSEPFSSLSHLLASGLFAFCAALMVIKGRGNKLRVFALTLFGFSLVFLFSMSGVYHLLEPGGTPRDVLRHLDHAAIWVLIAGSFTPIQIILFRGFWRWSILTLVWILAINGIIFKTIFFTEIPEWLGLMFYLGLGWLGVLSGYRIKKQFGKKYFHWFWLGGLFYTIGAVLDFSGWPIIWYGVIGPHEVFHIFVALGSLSHWLFIYSWCDHPIKDEITFHVCVYPNKTFFAKAVDDHLPLKANSKEELMDAIYYHCSNKFHSSVRPQVLIRYFDEELIRF